MNNEDTHKTGADATVHDVDPMTANNNSYVHYGPRQRLEVNLAPNRFSAPSCVSLTDVSIEISRFPSYSCLRCDVASLMGVSRRWLPSRVVQWRSSVFGIWDDTVHPGLNCDECFVGRDGLNVGHYEEARQTSY